MSYGCLRCRRTTRVRFQQQPLKYLTNARAIIGDEKGSLKVAYQRALKMNELAWDVYYVYKRGAEWTGDLPPVPDYYMHQLRSLPPERMLDGDKLAEEINKLLEQK